MGGGLQLSADQDRLHCRSRLKIRRAPSCKISAASSSSSHSSSSFCPGRSCRQINPKASTTTSTVSQPLIFHTFDPEVIVTEPAEFMSVVQRLTGSPRTRRVLRVLMRQRKEMETSELRGPDGELMAQQDPLKEGTTIILAPTVCCSNAEVCTNDSPSSRTCPNVGNSGENISHLPQLLSANHLAAPLSSHGKQHNLIINHPLSSISANSALSEENTRQPKSPSFSNPMSNNSAISEENPSHPKSPSFSKCKYTSPLSNNPPLSPNSSLTTSSLEGYHTDNLSTVEEGGASSYREASFSWLEQGNSQQLEEDGSINFFVFSRDSYYGNLYHAAQLGELDQLLTFSHAFDPFSSPPPPSSSPHQPNKLLI